MQIGAQFYTIREYCKTLEDFSESLKKVADIGYKTVQISGTCAYEPHWLKEELEKSGLKCVITHTPGDKMIADPKQVAANHDVFGCKHVGLGAAAFKPESLREDYENFLNNYIPTAKALKECGKYFMYHNHAHEFQKLDGKVILEKIAEDFDPEILGFTLDTFWVQAGGGDPAQWIEKLSGRLPCIHLKDFAYTSERCMAPIGEGNINWDRVFEKAQSAGTQYMLVEQDNCNGQNPFDCLKRSYDFLKANGFE